MATPAEAAGPLESPGAVPAPDVVLASYYGGEPVPCPVGCGGEAEAVRVSTMVTGAGEVWIECRSCAQRGRYVVPASTDEERRGIEAMVAESRQATCPRHARRAQLRRRGRQLVCPECGVRYRE